MKVYDVRQMPSDDKSSHGLWPGELIKQLFIIYCLLTHNLFIIYCLLTHNFISGKGGLIFIPI